MKSFAYPALAFASLLSVTSAHTRFTTLHINGRSQGDGVCIRQDQNPGTTTNFLPSLTGSEMACGIDGTIPNPSICSLNAGDQISLEHRMWPDASQPGAIDVSHKGNTAIYMKKINSQSDQVAGGGWFKIYWDGYDSTTGQWGTDHMNANNGLVTTNVPTYLAAGSYLIRSEVLALQNVGEPQFYVGCAQVQLSGSGSAAPSNTATIPGYIDMSTSAMNVNIYESFTFTEYGPSVYGSGGSSGNATSKSSSGSSSGVNSAFASGSSSTVGTDVLVISESTSTSKTSNMTTSTVDTSDSSANSKEPSSTSGWTGDSGDSSEVDAEADEESTINGGDDDNAEIADDSDQNGSHGWHQWSRWNDVKTRVRRSIAALNMRV
ncbi:hypothetical protein LTS08_003430 [Lithohypha guttulata]|nr:hypothetical protein LTS08_003430 [Lithohypha guttulata]